MENDLFLKGCLVGWQRMWKPTSCVKYLSCPSITCYHTTLHSLPALTSEPLLPGSLCNWFSIDREVFINILQERGEVLLLVLHHVEYRDQSKYQALNP